MNATQRLYDEIERAYVYLPGEEAIRLSEALAAAKEEQAKVLTDDPLKDLRPFRIEEGKKEGYFTKIVTKNGSVFLGLPSYPIAWAYGKKYAHAVADALNLAPAKSSGLDVEQVMNTLSDLFTAAIPREEARKRLEDLATNGKG